MHHITHSFDSETKTKIGKNTYIVVSHFDNTGESLQEKICQLLKSEVESRIAQVRDST